MRGIKHPMTDEIYEVSDDGLHVVVTSDVGSGVFTFGGQWISGELKAADAHSCGWLEANEERIASETLKNRTGKCHDTCRITIKRLDLPAVPRPDTHEVNPMLRLTSDVDFGTMNIY